MAVNCLWCGTRVHRAPNAGVCVTCGPVVQAILQECVAKISRASRSLETSKTFATRLAAADSVIDQLEYAVETFEARQIHALDPPPSTQIPVALKDRRDLITEELSSIWARAESTAEAPGPKSEGVSAWKKAARDYTAMRAVLSESPNSSAADIDEWITRAWTEAGVDVTES